MNCVISFNPLVLTPSPTSGGFKKSWAASSFVWSGSMASMCTPEGEGLAMLIIPFCIFIEQLRNSRWFADRTKNFINAMEMSWTRRSRLNASNVSIHLLGCRSNSDLASRNGAGGSPSALTGFVEGIKFQIHWSLPYRSLSSSLDSSAPIHLTISNQRSSRKNFDIGACCNIRILHVSAKTAHSTHFRFS